MIQGLITDGYKNVSSKHVLGVVVKANEVRMLYDSIEEGSRHDAISEAIEHEKLFDRVATDFGNGVLRYVTTDSGGGVNRARKILALRHADKVFVACQAHQVVIEY